MECNRQFTGLVIACPHDGALLRPILQDPLIGTVLAGNYEILEVLGHGGMGVVYRGKHTLMERVVAIKMLQSQLISDTNSVKRFQQESKAAAKLKHPHIIDVYDFGISPAGQPYIVMEFLEGTPLSDLIKREGQVGVERSIKILSQACDALDHAHKQGVVHRDLKPSNVVLTVYDEEKDYVKVVDFGVAKLIEQSQQEGQRLTQAGEVCGSPVYMSPEQCMGQDLDARSDIYSMGVVLYETLTGKLPILGKTMVDTMSKHISETPAPFSESRPDLYIPERLEAVVMRALSKLPDDRQQSMEELKLELELAIPRPGRSVVLRAQEQPSPAEAFSKFLKEVPVWTWAVALAGILSFGALVARTILSPPAPQPTPAPVTQTQPPPVQQTPAPTPTQNPASAANPSTTAPVAPTPAVKAPPASKPAHAVASRSENAKTHKRRAYESSYTPEDVVENASDSRDATEVYRRYERRPKKRAASASAPAPRPVKKSSGDPFKDLMNSRSY
ncbi:MAG TPA: protein kinase [Candidatus Obscuribacterales bacterium]